MTGDSTISIKDNKSQKCHAMIKFDGKVNSTNSIFGEYSITIGARVYANETDTTPKSLPTQTFIETIEMPETDFSKIYEE